MYNKYSTDNGRQWVKKVNAGDLIYLSGVVYTARDAVHKKLVEMISKEKPLPFDLKDSFIYFAGPTPPVGNLATGACGPTTSSRMDVYTPTLMDMGLLGTIGKGERNEMVRDAIIRNGGIYLCAIGGAGALAAMSITSAEVIAFPELGCESVKKLKFSNFPLYVAIDSKGNSIFEK